MKTLKHTPKDQAKVIPITPKWILQKEAMAYVGLSKNTFKKMAREQGLSVYAHGRNLVWYNLEEIDIMIESFCIKKKKKPI